MILSFPLLGACTVRLEGNAADPVGWLMALICFFMYGVGTLLSGSPYLALVRDSAPKEKQGLAIGIVEVVLISFFPISAIGFGRMLENYDPGLFLRLVLFVTVVAGFFWFFAVVGTEKVNRQSGVLPIPAKSVNLRQTLSWIWADGRTRLFFLFLFVATFSAWIQDSVLEPFGADVFGMEVSQTTRLTAYWGTATVLVLLVSFYIWRERRPEDQKPVTRAGLVLMGVGMALVVFSAIAGRQTLFLAGLVLFGTGFGFYTFGGLSLMAAMSPAPNSGAYLGLWTVAILVSKGSGTFTGGLVRDIILASNSSYNLAYAVVFALSTLGLFAAAWLAGGLDVKGFAQEEGLLLEVMDPNPEGDHPSGRPQE